jgi:glycosyltransferase involved in cell wall biosynthesis
MREMGYAYGLPGLRAARAIFSEPSASESYHYPLFNRIAKISQGLIVHTRTARTQILQEVPQTRVIALPLAARASTDPSKSEKPAWLARLPVGAVVLASFGYIAPSKRIDIVLQAVARLQAAFSQLYYVLVGEPVDHYDLAPLIQQLTLEDRVHITGFVDSAVFEAFQQMVDIGINLRTGPTGGEMSAGVVQLLAAGKPTIVSNIGGFSELPSSCVIKIDQDDYEVDRLATALQDLINEPGLRAAYGSAALHYAEHELAFRRIAARYAEFIQECVAEKWVDSLDGQALPANLIQDH